MIKSATAIIAALCLAFFFTGCEGDDGGETHDFGDNDPNLYVAIGDSLTEGMDTAGYPPILAGLLGKTVINEGHGGYRASDGVDVCNSALIHYKPGYILIWYGANDAIHGANVEDVIASLRTMIDAAKANKTIPYIATVTPMYGEHSIFDGGGEAISAGIRILASEEGIVLVDLRAAFGSDESYYSGDGLHFNDTGDQLVAQTFYNALQ